MAGNDKSMLMKDIMNDILAAAGTEVSIIPVVQVMNFSPISKIAFGIVAENSNVCR